MKKKIIIFLLIFVPIIAFIVGINWRVFKASNYNKKVNTSNSANVFMEDEDSNSSSNSNAADVSSLSSISTFKETTFTGRVFIKGYGTPSESYGLITSDGYEIGLGSYDLMKEQFRSFVNDNIKVTFSKICKSATKDCCLSLFYYCGEVKSWEKIE